MPLAGVRYTLKSWWLILRRKEEESLNGSLCALYRPGETYDSENHSFPALRQLYTSVPTRPYPSSSLYSCFVSRVEYCRAVHGGDALSDFVVAHVRHPCASRCVGYIVIGVVPTGSPRSPDNDNNGTPTSGDMSQAIWATATIANTYDDVLDVLRRDGCTKSQTLLHANIAPHACPLSYLVAAGQTLHEHYGDPEHGQDSWFAAVLFRLIADNPDRTGVTRAGRTLDPGLLSLATAAHVDDCAPGLEMQYNAEITNVRVMVEAARARRRAADAERLEAWKAMEGPARGAVEMALNTAMCARDAALVAVKMAERERTLRKAAEARERKIEDALQAVKRRTEARERTLLKRITTLQGQKEE